MASEDPTKDAPKGRMSLYANLLSDTDAPGTISRAPVVFKQDAEADAPSDDPATKKPQLNTASLRFQPTRRPQQSSQKPKSKNVLPKAAPQPVIHQASLPSKSTVADWTSREEDDQEYLINKRQRGGKKKRKKNPHEQEHLAEDWNLTYLLGSPIHYQQYRHSEEKFLEVREWRDHLYRHRMKRSLTRDMDSEDERPTNQQFAPPSNFAPPPNINTASTSQAVQAPDDASGEDAFARRAALAQPLVNDSTYVHAQIPPPPPPEEPAPPVPSYPSGQNIPPPPPTQPLNTFQPSSATISRAPVRYSLPPPPEDMPASEAELEASLAQEQDEEVQDDNAPRSNRPGQKGFAERLLAKQGWTKGSGLGATGSGMVKPLQVQVEKRKKRPDAEGGGFVTPAGRGKIIGGKQSGQYESKFGPMCEVIILRGMLDGIDIDSELENSQNGGLMQEIGEECNEKYGTVERIFIARDAGTPIPVFVKFVSPLSALRAVNALEGRVFNGNTIVARFFDREKFDQGVYVD